MARTWRCWNSSSAAGARERDRDETVRRIALLLEYDGAAYGGSQFQRNAPSVQAVLEEAIARLTGTRVRAAFAGRTDAGVHALGQVAAFSTDSVLSRATLWRGLNALLPADVAVHGVAETAAGFDPRRHAVWRLYRYRLWNGPVARPLARAREWHVPGPLAVEAMQRETRVLVGDHDLAAFAGSPGPGRTTRRQVFDARVTRTGPAIVVQMRANAFLPHQIRRTVGALVEIGRGRLPSGTFARWLEQPRSGVAGPAAPAHGLYLVRVRYDSPGVGPDEWYRGRSEGQQRNEDIQHQAE